MRGAFITFLIVLAVVAIFTIDSYAFVLFYLFAMAYLLGRWWVDRTAGALHVERTFARRAFPGEQIPVQVKITNSSRLPIVWLHTQELLPLEVSNTKMIQRVLSLGPRSTQVLEYPLDPKKRGVYALGPLQLSTGDLLGLIPEKGRQTGKDDLIVYPRVVPLLRVPLPSSSPMGTLRHEQPVFEDPSRPAGKRDYTPGDSLRRIDWKSSASVGRLQVKQYEPSIALETMLFLNLNKEEYFYKFRYDDSELAIVVAASLSNWIVAHKQSVGLVANAIDPLIDHQAIPPLPSRKGRAHFMRILENLARAQLGDLPPIHQVLKQQRPLLSWGTTAIIITGTVEDALFDEIFSLRRSGVSAVLVLCGEAPGGKDVKARAEHFHIPFFLIRDERDLDIWRI